MKERIMKLFFSITLAFVILSSTASNCAQFQASATPAFGTEERNRLYNEEATKRLTQALEELDEEAAREALRAGADPTYNDHGWPHLKKLTDTFEFSSYGKHPQINRERDDKLHKLAQLLLSNKADVNANDLAGNAVFGFALPRAPLSFIRLLIDAGADIDTETPGVRTPLIIAVVTEYLELVELLLSRGVNTAKPDSSDKTALDHLLQKTEDYINPQWPLHRLIKKENLNTMFEIFKEYFSRKNDQTSLSRLKEMAYELKHTDPK